ncbi:hypothetical protein PLICRDRAFT_442543 [Plicaturopsis crispa FD-325 SS-3]|uniref:Uncharacterized protein n=1 Tax=Plicaturopsis crispa FD-325 SS-3 TaxID=944288 RepID=A0A0C9SWM7_PLICR|nr:hypothetical protein PLICRDRAFT_442543 [Plicaturopsis crispa FD-325 SS-3]
MRAYSFASSMELTQAVRIRVPSLAGSATPLPSYGLRSLKTAEDAASIKLGLFGRGSSDCDPVHNETETPPLSNIPKSYTFFYSSSSQFSNCLTPSSDDILSCQTWMAVPRCFIANAKLIPFEREVHSV